MALSVIIPTYNEEKNITHTLSQVHDVLKNSHVGDYEIIVVDDGSTDDTPNILDRCSMEFQWVRHEQNRGYGASLKSGIRKSRYDIIAITDADGTYPVKDIPKLYGEMTDCDMVVGARTGKKAKIPWLRKPAKWFLAKLANYLSETKIPDLNSGLRLFRKDYVMHIFGILPKGFSFTTTLTLAMLTSDMNVKFIPIEYMKRTGKSKIRPIRDTLNFIQLILRTILYFNPMKVFVPIAFFLFFSSFFIFFFSAFALGRILDTTVSILFVAGIHMLSIGMIADIIDRRTKL